MKLCKVSRDSLNARRPAIYQNPYFTVKFQNRDFNHHNNIICPCMNAREYKRYLTLISPDECMIHTPASMRDVTTYHLTSPTNRNVNPLKTWLHNVITQ